MNKVSLTTRLILPLVLDKGSSYLLNEFNYGFVGAYLGDINKPYLDDHVLLVYKSIESYLNYRSRHSRLTTLPNFYSWYSYKVNGEFYEIYVLTRDSFDSKVKMYVKALIEGRTNDLEYFEKIKILNYWGSTINSIEHSLLFQPEVINMDYLKCTFECDILPEEDPPGDIMFKVSQVVEETI